MAVQTTHSPNSDTSTTVGSPTSDIQQQTPVSAAPGGTRGFGGQQPAGVMSLFAGFGMSANLGADVDKYLDDIRKALAATGQPYKVQRMMTSTIVGAHVVSLGEVAILLAFPKLQNTPRRPDAIAPYGEWLEIAKAEFRKEFVDGLKLINGLVILPDDLARVDQMVTYLRDALLQANDSALQQMTAAQFLSSVDVGYESSAEHVRNLTATHFPQAVLPRADGGLVLRLRQAGSRGKHGGFGLNSLSDPSRLLAWVTAYVDFIVTTPGLGQTKYTPVVHISSIQSIAQDRHSMMFALAAAVDWYITRNGWIELVTNFNQAARMPNIGNLLQNDDGTLFFATNLQQATSVAQVHCAAPTLVIDFVDGQAHIPALAQFIDTSAKGAWRLADYVTKFFGTQTLDFKNTNRLLSSEYVGSVNVNGQIVDSRHVAYLDVLARSQAPVPDAAGLLNIMPGQPTYRAQIVNGLNPTFEPIYQEQVVMPSVDLLQALISLISSTGFPLYCETSSSTFFSAVNYTGLGEQLSGLGALQQGGQMGQPALRMGGYYQY